MKKLILTLAALAMLSFTATAQSRRTVQFGSYPQEASGGAKSPISWLVLGEKDGYTLLLSRDVLDSILFHKKRAEITYEKSDIRAWLTLDFYNVAFTESEKAALKADGDRVFLLSHEEVERYLPRESDRLTKPTARARRNGVYTNSSGECAWWLRSPSPMGKNQSDYLSSGGSFGYRAHYVDDPAIVVRPAVWVKTKSLK